MAKPAIVFVCADCGAETLKWQGQCPQCSQWNTLEQRVRRAPSGRAGGRRFTAGGTVRAVRRASFRAFRRAWAELDRVLGGGLIPGSVTLLGGEPGIGKSTLLLQLANHAARVTPTLYLSAEESAAQIGVRARRLGVSGSHLRVVADTDLEAMMARARDEAVKLLIVDSIQTVQLASVGTAAGAITQLKECTAQLVRFAKSSGRQRDHRRPRDQGWRHRRSRACSSTWSTPCCISRAMHPAVSATCAPPRTASVRWASWRSSTWASQGCAKCATHRRFSWRVPARRRRAASWR